MKIDMTRDDLEFFLFCAENVYYPPEIQTTMEDDNEVDFLDIIHQLD